GESRSEEHRSIRSDWWNPGWIPFVSSGSGHYFCIDTDPAEGGVPGQVILWLHDSPRRYLVACSLAEWFSAIADDLEAGTYIYDGERTSFNHHAFMRSSVEGKALYD
ncbi:MAG: SMI1/KNR4 family protein, partial [Myxococcota bacterium]